MDSQTTGVDMNVLNLYLIQQSQNNGYDTYDSAVVAAVDEKRAAEISPSGVLWDEEKQVYGKYAFFDWCNHPEHVSVQRIGTTEPGTKEGVICSSFNAG